MYLLAFFILIFIILLVKGYRKASNNHYKYQDIRSLLEVLLNRGLLGATLIVSERKTKNFLQYAKYFSDSGDFGIKMDFPKAEWSAGYFNELQNLLSHKSIAFKLEKPSDENGLEFLTVNFNQDIELAFSVTENLLLDIMKIEINTVFNAEFENISPWNEVIRTKEQKLLSNKEGIQTLKRDKNV